MDKFNDLHAFFKTAELGSFVAAGRALGLTASAVGKSVARLEAALGVRVLQRSTRRMQLTDEGRLLQAHCERLLHELDAAREHSQLAMRRFLGGWHAASRGRHRRPALYFDR